MLKRWFRCCFKIKMFPLVFKIESPSVNLALTLCVSGSLLSLLAVASRCWSMDSKIGSVCTQNVDWETHLKGEASFYLLSAVFRNCAELNLQSDFLGWFRLDLVLWPLLILWSFTWADKENRCFLKPHLHLYILLDIYFTNPTLMTSSILKGSMPGAIDRHD